MFNVFMCITFTSTEYLQHASTNFRHVCVNANARSEWDRSDCVNNTEHEYDGLCMQCKHTSNTAHMCQIHKRMRTRVREKEHERENESALTRRNEKAAWLSEEVKVQAIINLNSIAIFHTHRSSYPMPMAWGLFDASILRFSTFYSPRFPVKYYERIFSLCALPLPCYSFFYSSIISPIKLI